MNNNFPLMIPGAPEREGDLLVTVPYSGDEIASVALGNTAHVEQALLNAQGIFQDQDNWLTVASRIQIFENLLNLMQEHAEDLACGVALEGGKPLLDSRVEVARAIEGIKLCIGHISSEAGSVIPLHESNPDVRRVAFTQKEPIGIVVAVSAFNHPLNLIVHQVGAAIAAGCPVIVKPADDTPLSCIRFVQLLREAGLPEEWCQVILTVKIEQATALVTDPRVALFSFIGSARVGWMLRGKLARGTRCILEHGGAAPVIVDESADFDKLIPALLKGGFYHAGQVCVSVQRVFAPESQVDAISRQLAEGAASLRVGDPLSEETEVGPLIRPAEVDRVELWVREAIEEGAQLLAGGERLPNQCFQPTVLLNPSPFSKVSTSEVFGPVVCVYGYSDIKEAIAQANSLEFAFQAAVFAQDIDRAMHIGRQLDASAVMINDHTAFRQDDMPFAGLRQSGLGVGGIRHSIDEMQNDKMMVIKTTASLQQLSASVPH